VVDNTILSTGSGGDTIATDDIAGIKFQRVKLVEGADGVNDGDISSANPLPVEQIGATPAGANNIGDVDVLTVPSPLSTAGGGTEAAALRVTIANDSTGLVSVDDNAGSITVDQATATNLKAEVVGPTADNSANPTAKLSVLSGVANAAAPTRTEGNVVPLRMNLAGDVAVTLDSEAVVLGAGTANIGDVDVLTLPALVAGTANIGDVDVLSGPTGASAFQTQGEVAHDAADANNPQKIGGQARITNPTAVADADRVNAIFDDVGRQIVILNQVRDLVAKNKITLSTTTETTLLAAGAAGVFHDVTLIVITNSSATAVRVDIRDATAGTTVLEVAIAANGGAVIPFPTPLPQAAAANNWTAQLSAAVTDVRIFIQAVKNV